MARSLPGRLAPRLLLVAGLGFAGFWIAVASGQRGGDTLASNWLLTGPMAVAVGAVLGAGGAGLVAIVRHRDWSVGTVASTVLGALVLLWIGLEVAFPH